MSGFFRTLAVSAPDVAQHPGAIRQLRTGGIDAILVSGIYDEPECAALCARLERGEHALPGTRFPPLMGGSFLGANLNLAHPALETYFEAAQSFRQALDEVFDGMAGLEQRVTALLSRLDGGRSYCAAPGPAGQDHMFTTLRCHPAGAFIPPHFDNEQGFRQSYRFIQPNVVGDLFSFVLAFSRAEAGGALEMFDIEHDGQPWRMADGAQDASGLALDDVERVSFRLAPGEMILINSGRFLHRLTPVSGPRSRWTACSFMAESLAGNAVHCWG